jgi:pyrimidine operon attenuation protein/uracil phosphoribosyltransferase
MNKVSARNQILSKEVAERKMQRIALEITAQLYDKSEPVIIIGIAGSGMVIADKLFHLLKLSLQTPIQLITCTLDKKNANFISYSEDADFNNKNVILVDDVTNSGRTLLYALKPLLEYHPASIQTMSLVERMHKSFPVKIDYIGLSIATTLQDHIQVEVESGEVIGAFIM